MKILVSTEFSDFYLDEHESLAVSEGDNSYVLTLATSGSMDIGYSNDLGVAICQ